MGIPEGDIGPGKVITVPEGFGLGSELPFVL